MAHDIKYILLDVGGVIVHDPMHELFFELESLGEKRAGDIENWFEENLRYPLWSGAIEEDEFWGEILAYTDAAEDMGYWKEYIRGSSRLLPGAARMKDLSSIAPLTAISNHRHEWLVPILGEHDLDKYFDEVFISSEIGEVKPDQEIFEHVLSSLGASPEEVVFIDDNERNLVPAAVMGLRIISGDPDGDWIDQLF